MGFWSTIGTIGGLALAPFTGGASMIPALTAGGAALGGGIDAFTGGGNPFLGDVGAAAAGASAGAAKGRMSQAEIQQAQDRLALQRYSDALAGTNAENAYGFNSAAAKNRYGLEGIDAASTINNMDLARRKFQLAAPGERAGNAVRGDILSRAQDVAIAGAPGGLPIPTISGGLRPSMFSGTTRALGTNMTNQALSEQQKGDQFGALPSVPDYTAPPPYISPGAPPPLTDLPAAGVGSTILNTAGTIGTLADILARYRRRQMPPGTNLNDPNTFVGPMTPLLDPSLEGGY